MGIKMMPTLFCPQNIQFFFLMYVFRYFLTLESDGKYSIQRGPINEPHFPEATPYKTKRESDFGVNSYEEWILQHHEIYQSLKMTLLK